MENSDIFDNPKYYVRTSMYLDWLSEFVCKRKGKTFSSRHLNRIINLSEEEKKKAFLVETLFESLDEFFDNVGFVQHIHRDNGRMIPHEEFIIEYNNQYYSIMKVYGKQERVIFSEITEEEAHSCCEWIYHMEVLDK